jgi:tricorn protease
MKNILRCIIAASSLIATSAFTLAGPTKMLEQPDLSAQHITFVYAQDIWLANRDGSNAKRLTADGESQMRPHFSPDGKHIAFTANYGNNEDVYVMSIDGGAATRLTWHPSDDIVEGWSNDARA